MTMAIAEAPIAMSSAYNAVGQSYRVGTGRPNATMPTKCIAQMPMPSAVPPKINHTITLRPRAAVTRAMRSSVAYDATTATSIESATMR